VIRRFHRFNPDFSNRFFKPMKTLLLLAAFLLSSCAGSVAGLSLQDRLKLYGIAAGLYGVPFEITLEGVDPK